MGNSVFVVLMLAIVAGVVWGAVSRQKAAKDKWQAEQAEESQQRAYEIYRWLTREDAEALHLTETPWLLLLVGRDRYQALVRQWYPPSQPTGTGTALDAYLG